MSHQNIHILRSQFIAGINRWAYKPVMETLIDINDFENHPTSELEGFNSRLVQLLPGLSKHKCNYGYEGGFLKRLDEGTWIGHVLEHAIIELQVLMGLSNKFGQTRQTSKPGIYYMVFACDHEKLGRELLHTGLELILAIVCHQSFDLDAHIQRLKDLSYDVLPGPSSGFLIQAFKNKGYPIIRPGSDNRYQVGYGCEKRLFWTATTEKTSAISVEISKDKSLTKALLEECFIPVSQGVVVTQLNEACEAAKQFDRVVIKPLNNRRGHGVSLDLYQTQDVSDAFHYAKEYSDDILVEKFYPGNEYRFSLVDHQVIGILTGESLHVVGDGQSNIKQLIETINAEPERGFNESYLLTGVYFDDALKIILQKQHVQLETILAQGQRIEVRKNFNLKNIVPIENFHPSIIQHVILASKIIGLDIAGIDAVIKNIQQPLSQDNGVIIEVNAGPAFAIFHQQPNAINNLDMASDIADSILKEPKPRFSLISITASKHSPTLPFFIQSLYHRVGMSLPEGIYLNGNNAIGANDNLYDNGLRILMNPSCQTGIIASDFSSLVNHGVCYQKNTCKITILLDVDHQHYAHELYIDSHKAVKKVFRTPLDMVPKEGLAIINGDDHALVSWAELVDGKVIFICTDPNISHAQEKRRQNDGIIYIKAGHIYYQSQKIANCPAIPKQALQILMTGLAIALFENMSIEHVLNSFYKDVEIATA